MKNGVGVRFDSSALFLVLSNVFTMVVAVVAQWDLSHVMWVFWGQSVVIGYFSWRRIRCLRRYTADDLRYYRVPFLPHATPQAYAAFSFAWGYGLAHVLYFLILLATVGLSGSAAVGVVACTAVFAANGLFSFRRTLERDSTRTRSLKSLAQFPFLRVLPMHATIVVGALLESGPAGIALQSTGILLLFLSLKTVADLGMHLIEQRETGLLPAEPTLENASDRMAQARRMSSARAADAPGRDTGEQESAMPSQDPVARPAQLTSESSRPAREV